MTAQDGWSAVRDNRAGKCSGGRPEALVSDLEEVSVRPRRSLAWYLDLLAVYCLEGVSQGGSVALLAYVRPHLDGVVGSDAD